MALLLVILGIIAFGVAAVLAGSRKDYPIALIAVGLILTLWTIHPLA